MDELLTQQVIKSAIGTAFALLQVLIITVFGALVKTYFDVKKLRYDMNAAFKKIRSLEGTQTKEGSGDD